MTSQKLVCTASDGDLLVVLTPSSPELSRCKDREMRSQYGEEGNATAGRKMGMDAKVEEEGAEAVPKSGRMKRQDGLEKRLGFIG